MTQWYWVSTVRMTCAVAVDTRTSLIIDTAPILWKFRGQPLDNLLRWMGRQSGFTLVQLENTP